MEKIMKFIHKYKSRILKILFGLDVSAFWVTSLCFFSLHFTDSLAFEQYSTLTLQTNHLFGVLFVVIFG